MDLGKELVGSERPMDLMGYLKENFGVVIPGDVRWSHAVNSKEKLNRFLNKDNIHFIESDIRKSPSGVIIAAHSVDDESDLTIEELLEKLKSSKQGIKLDFKDPDAFKESIGLIKSAGLSQPVILNADILQGNGANEPPFNAEEFIEICQREYPEGILSLGWTTKPDKDLPYRIEEVDRMLKLIGDISNITFPVRACLLPNSMEQLKRLLDKDPSYTLSVWNNESVDDELRDWIKEYTDPERTFYDFIDDNKDPLILW